MRGRLDDVNVSLHQLHRQHQLQRQRQLTEAANVLMQHNAPTDHELFNVLNDIIGGSSAEECKRLAAEPSIWKFLLSEVWWRSSPTASHAACPACT